MKTRILSVACGLLLSGSVLAEENWSTSISTGLPFFLTPELSYQANNSDIRYYANLKIGLDNGAAIGFETPFSTNKKHSFGAFFGSVGVHDGDTDCRDNDDLGSAIGCALADAFDWERVDGIGISYRYSFNQFNAEGMYTRFEVGYGKGDESNRDLTSGSFLIGYQF